MMVPGGMCLRALGSNFGFEAFMQAVFIAFLSFIAFMAVFFFIACEAFMAVIAFMAVEAFLAAIVASVIRGLTNSV
jgi:hypothetical protein